MKVLYELKDSKERKTQKMYDISFDQYKNEKEDWVSEKSLIDRINPAGKIRPSTVNLFLKNKTLSK